MDRSENGRILARWKRQELTSERVESRTVSRFDSQDFRRGNQQALVSDQGRSANICVNTDKFQHSRSSQERLDGRECRGKVECTGIDIGSGGSEGLSDGLECLEVGRFVRCDDPVFGTLCQGLLSQSHAIFRGGG